MSWLLVVALCAVCSGAQSESKPSSSGEQYAGEWTGTWDGAGNGEFNLTLEKNKEGPVTGKVAVTTDAGSYNAAFKTLAFEGEKMSAKYDFPLDAGAEVVLTAVFENSVAKGTWSLRPKGLEGEVAKGTWTVTRK